MFFDYKNIEPRLLAFFLAKGLDDWKMAQEFIEGKDPYQEIANELGIQRQDAKTFVLSLMYGGGTGTISRQLGLSKDKAFSLLQTFHKRRPGVRNLKQQLENVLERRGYVHTLWGRHLHPPEAYKAINTLIQGSAAELMRDALRKTHRYAKQNWESHIVLTVHDDLGLDCNETEIKDIATVVPTLMGNDTIASVVPIEVETSISFTNWGEKEVYEN